MELLQKNKTVRLPKHQVNFLVLKRLYRLWSGFYYRLDHSISSQIITEGKLSLFVQARRLRCGEEGDGNRSDEYELINIKVVSHSCLSFLRQKTPKASCLCIHFFRFCIIIFFLHLLMQLLFQLSDSFKSSV